MINEKFVNHVITILATLVFLGACYKASAQDLHIVSGSISTDKVEIIHSLESGDYFLAIRYVDGKFMTYPLKSEGQGTQKLHFDNIGDCSFATAMLLNDMGAIIWRGKLGIDQDCD